MASWAAFGDHQTRPVSPTFSPTFGPRTNAAPPPAHPPLPLVHPIPRSIFPAETWQALATRVTPAGGSDRRCLRCRSAKAKRGVLANESGESAAIRGQQLPCRWKRTEMDMFACISQSGGLGPSTPPRLDWSQCRAPRTATRMARRRRERAKLGARGAGWISLVPSPGLARSPPGSGGEAHASRGAFSHFVDTRLPTLGGERPWLASRGGVLPWAVAGILRRMKWLRVHYAMQGRYEPTHARVAGRHSRCWKQAGQTRRLETPSNAHAPGAGAFSHATIPTHHHPPSAGQHTRGWGRAKKQALTISRKTQPASGAGPRRLARTRSPPRARRHMGGLNPPSKTRTAGRESVGEQALVHRKGSPSIRTLAAEGPGCEASAVSVFLFLPPPGRAGIGQGDGPAAVSRRAGEGARAGPVAVSVGPAPQSWGKGPPDASRCMRLLLRRGPGSGMCAPGAH